MEIIAAGNPFKSIWFFIILVLQVIPSYKMVILHFLITKST